MSEDRRRYFRVTDRVGLRYRVLTEDEWQSFVESGSPEELEQNHGLFGHNLDLKLGQAISSLRKVCEEAATVAWLLNQKVEELVDQLQAQGVISNFAIQSVNISACGLALYHEEGIPVGSKLLLEIMLRPEEKYVTTLAEVVICSFDAQHNRYLLRLTFVDTDDAGKEALIQHVVRRQSAILQEQGRTGLEKDLFDVEGKEDDGMSPSER
ncbi:PilZ domain-containing protein [Zooshikella harenae]|uniref:PilZ domain-containing protein n=1 Tax=Zooshikella harenae TaxID=2827238 RepID=A0ABS5ZF36_9GAMM|nr:PilZ domain-containing protein [Zooshikella harenae]MBU2712674.1 PilZ domain-containing protein [Zooshikella harenae]